MNRVLLASDKADELFPTMLGMHIYKSFLKPYRNQTEVSDHLPPILPPTPTFWLDASFDVEGSSAATTRELDV